MDDLIQKACATNMASENGYRCHLDGEIVEDEYIKLACLKLEECAGTGGGGPTIALSQ